MNLEERVEHRKQNFMKPNNYEEEFRIEFAVNLRKKKRLSEFQKKRKQTKLQSDVNMLDSGVTNPIISEVYSILDSMTSEDQLEQNLIALKSLCQKCNVCFLLDHPQIVTKLNLFTQQHFSDNVSSIVMSIWGKIFTENTLTCKKALSLIPISSILQAINIHKPKTCQKALVCLGNLASDCRDFRIQLINENAQAVILQLVIHCSNIDVCKVVSFFYLHISKEQNMFTLKKLDELLSGLRHLVFFEDGHVLSQCLIAMHNIIREDLKKIERLTHFGVIERLISLSSNASASISESALKVIGDIAYGDICHINILIEHGLFDLLTKTICLSRSQTRKESMYVISNILASGATILEEVMKHELSSKIVQSLRENDKEILLEVSYIFKNFAVVGSWKHFEGLLNLGVLAYLKDVLRHHEVETCKNFLAFTEKLLIHAKENQALWVFDDFSSAGCVESVEVLQKHMNAAIYHKVSEILNYFVTNEEMNCDEDRSLESLPVEFII